MARPSNRTLFYGSILVSMIMVMGGNYFRYWQESRNDPKMQQIGPGVFLSSQLKPENLPGLRRLGVRIVVDLRPDGEAADQPSSEVMSAAAKQSRVTFYYIPVPHESLPDEAVDRLRSLLEGQPARKLLYCRTGRRAVRLYALAEASQKDGMTAEEIQSMVSKAGFTAEDLSTEITRRIAMRSSPSTTIPP